MYQITAIQKAFAGLVGFRSIDVTTFPELPKSLLSTRSGLYANDAHAILNNATIIASLPKENEAHYRAYNADVAYGLGDVVRSATSLLRSKKAENTEEPTVGESWELTTHVGEQLRRVYESSVQRMISDLFIHKKLSSRSKQIVQDTRLFFSVGNRNDLIVKRSRFVGVQFVLKDLRDLMLVVSEIGLHVTQNNVDFPIYIYETSSSQPAAIQPINTESGYQFSWNEVNPMQLKESLNGRFTFLVGYYEDDLAGQAVSIAKDWMHKPCSQCNQQDPPAYRAWSPYVEFHPFEVAEEELNADRSLFNLDAMSYDYKTNYGLNFRVGVKCDVTDTIIRNRDVFAPALQKYIQVGLLERIGFSTEVNAISEPMKQQARYILDPGGMSTGAKKEALDAIKSLDLDFSTMTSPCLQAVKKGGVRSVTA